MEYYARFERRDGHLFRFDTRIYLESRVSQVADTCIGAIVGKNPGSARPVDLGQLLPLELRGDKMLPTVGNLFAEGYARAEKRVPRNAFVRVWNLFYLCEADLGKAVKAAKTIPALVNCPTEDDDVPILWFGWGGENPALDPYKERFLSLKSRHRFFYDWKRKRVTANAPGLRDFAKHTQGMPGDPIADYLSDVI